MKIDKVALTILATLAVAFAFAVGGLVGSSTAYNPPTNITIQQGANGPDSVTLSLTLVHDVVPSLSEQSVVYAELDACADLKDGVSYTDTAAAVGAAFNVSGQPRFFLVTTAANTFCSDQDKNIHF